MRDHVTITNADLGISDDGRHTSSLTGIEAACIGVLEARGPGRDNAVPSDDLAHVVFGSRGDVDKRNLRELVNHLINTHLLPICSMPGYGGGYWLPASPEEEAAVYEARRKRALTGLMKMSRGRKAAYVETLEQLTLYFDEPEGKDAIERLRLTPEDDKGGMPAWLHLVTRLLAKLEQDPQRYAAEIRQLQQMYGGIFVPKAKVRQIDAKIREAGQMLASLAQGSGA